MGVGKFNAGIWRGQVLARSHLMLHIAVDISLGFYHAALVCYGTGAVDAATGAYVHLDEHMVHRFYILQNVGNTVYSVHRHVAVTIRQHIKRTDNALSGWVGFGTVGNRGLVTHRQSVDGAEVDAVLLEKL